MPDTLPGDAPFADDTDTGSRSRPSTSQKDAEAVAASSGQSDAELELAQRLGLVGVSDFAEGYIGKIRVRKSGRTELCLGNNTLDISLGTNPGFLQVLALSCLLAVFTLRCHHVYRCVAGRCQHSSNRLGHCRRLHSAGPRQPQTGVCSGLRIHARHVVTSQTACIHLFLSSLIKFTDYFLCFAFICWE